MFRKKTGFNFIKKTLFLSNRRGAMFAGSYSYTPGQIKYKNFAVADIACAGSFYDGVNCRLVPPGDADALEGVVAELLADPARAAALGQRARETVERHLRWERYTRQLGDLLAAAARPTTVPE